MAEEEIWKCPKHPSSKRRRNSGVCPTCLRDRLVILCPDCANIRPCGCCTTATSSSTSSSSSSFRTVGKMIESEPKFQRSKSVAIPFFRSNSVKTTTFGWLFKKDKTRKGETEATIEESKDEEDCYYDRKIGDFERMMMKSRSMRAPITSENRGSDAKSSSKGKSWYFPSPIKVFRQRSKVVQDRSPLQRY